MNAHQFVSMPTRPIWRWTTFGLTLLVALSCHDAPTASDPDRLAPPLSASRDASPGTVLGPVHVPIAETNTVGWGTLPWTGTGMTVPPYTSYIVKVSGRTTVSPNPGVLQCRPDYPPPYGSEGSYGPSGDRYYQLRVEPGLITSAGVGSVGLRYDGIGTSGGDNAQSDTVFTWDGGEIAMRRSGIQGSTNSSTGCVVWLYSLSSAQAISLVTFDGKELSVTPSWVAVKKGTVVSFRATSRGVLVDAAHWRFEAAPGATNQTTACGLSGPNPCAVTVQNSGTLRVALYTQGRMRAASAQVTVYSNFDLDAEPSDVVRGDTVTFTPTLDGVAGKAARWLWRGEDSSEAAAPCAPETAPCRYVPGASGTMWAYTAPTGGDSASAHVTVHPPSLDLNASKSTLEAPGDNVTFTATANGTLVVLGWSFTADGGSMDRLEIPSSSFAELSVTPHGPGGTQVGEGGRLLGVRTAVPRNDNTRPKSGSARIAVPTTSRRLASQGSAWGSCSPSSTQCTNFVSESGKVDVLATLNGDTVRANVHVNVVPCPTGDPVLDDPEIRRALKDLIVRSKPDLDNGDGVAVGDSIGNKRELAGDIFRRPDGTYYFVEDTQFWSTECTGTRSTMKLRKDTADVKVGDVHTHPDNQLVEAYGCLPKNGVPTQRGKWDTGRPPTIKQRDAVGGGGSSEDWKRLRILPENQDPLNPQVDGYILNADGEVWKLPKEMLDGHEDLTSNPNHWRWRLNLDPACNW